MLIKEEFIDEVVTIFDGYQAGFECCLFKSFGNFTKGKYNKYYLNTKDAYTNLEGYGKCIVEVESYKKMKKGDKSGGIDTITELFPEYLLVKFRINRSIKVKSVEPINMSDYRKKQEFELSKIIDKNAKIALNIIHLRGDFNEKFQKICAHFSEKK